MFSDPVLAGATVPCVCAYCVKVNVGLWDVLGYSASSQCSPPPLNLLCRALLKGVLSFQDASVSYLTDYLI